MKLLFKNNKIISNLAHKKKTGQMQKQGNAWKGGTGNPDSYPQLQYDMGDKKRRFFGEKQKVITKILIRGLGPKFLYGGSMDRVIP
jgi:hypothetical protein